MLSRNLNPKQLEAVESPEGPLLVAAGAGSGKTRTLTSRLIHLLKKGANPEEIIAITFTNKASKEMLSRLNFKELDENGGAKPFVGTFHSLGARILRKECALLGRSPRYSIFDDNDSREVVRGVVKKMGLMKGEFGPALALWWISKIKNELFEVQDVKTENARKDLLVKEVFLAYEAELQRNNAFDFDDLIEKPVRIFENHPEILNAYRRRTKCILVDEFQDINPCQYKFIRLLASEHKNVSVVGDDQQSIYGFRGSDFRNFLNFEHDWAGTKVVILDENYRSTGNIIRAASGVIANNLDQKPKDLWTKNQAGALIKIVEHGNDEEEAEHIAIEVQSSHPLRIAKRVGQAKFSAEGGPLPDGLAGASGGKVQNDSVAVLYRTNAQSRPIEQALIERNVPYRIYGGIRFYDRKEVKDIVSCLRYASNSRDAVSLERIKKNFLKKPSERLQAELPRMSSKNPTEIIGYALAASNYYEYLSNNFPNFRERIENIEALTDFSSLYPDLPTFIEKISLLQSDETVKAPPETGRSVNLMTIHAAKGLEFDRVFLAGTSEGILPHQMSYKDGREGIEEERRLIYVAMTRARKELILNFYNLASRFLYEIPPELVEFKSLNKPHLSALLDDEERFISLD